VSAVSTNVAVSSRPISLITGRSSGTSFVPKTFSYRLGGPAMLTVVRESASTSNPALRSRSAAPRIRPSSEAKAIAESEVIVACMSNIEVPPSERGDA
jgi:hypothetical protein